MSEKERLLPELGDEVELPDNFHVPLMVGAPRVAGLTFTMEPFECTVTVEFTIRRSHYNHSLPFDCTHFGHEYERYTEDFNLEDIEIIKR